MQTRPHTSHRSALLCGIRDGIPIGLGYLAVSFSLGIAARSAGLNAFQGFLISILNNASAGEYAAFTVIAADSGLLEMALITLITNALSSHELLAQPAVLAGYAHAAAASGRL